jgi:oligopeptide transport system ATP-binding protein
LLKDLQDDFNLTYIFIAHDLGVVRNISDRVGVMYLGHLAELSGNEQLYKNPKHPYTQALMSAVPVPDPQYETDRIILEGDVPSPANPPDGCPFHTRCPHVMDVCKNTLPQFREIEQNHYVACHLYNDDQ